MGEAQRNPRLGQGLSTQDLATPPQIAKRTQTASRLPPKQSRVANQPRNPSLTQRFILATLAVAALFTIHSRGSVWGHGRTACRALCHVARPGGHMGTARMLPGHHLPASDAACWHRAAYYSPAARRLARLRCQLCHDRPATAALIENPAGQAHGGPPTRLTIPLSCAPRLPRRGPRQSPRHSCCSPAAAPHCNRVPLAVSLARPGPGRAAFQRFSRRVLHCTPKTQDIEWTAGDAHHI